MSDDTKLIEDYAQRRAHDNRNETVGREYLESKLLQKFPTYKTCSERGRQVRGIDMTWTGKDGYEYKCDLKVAIWVAKYLGTGCLECAGRYERRGEWFPYTGWFLNENEESNSLAYLWIDGTTTDKDPQTPEDITKAEVCIVKTEDIWNYLGKLGWTREILKTKIAEIVGHEEEYFRTKWINNVGFNSPEWLYRKERPVNILLSRQVYRELAVFNQKW